MQDKLLDVGAERAVLAGLIQYGIDGYITISDFVNDDTFGNHNNQIIYKCVKHIINNDQSVDIASLLSAAEQLKFCETINTKQERK